MAKKVVICQSFTLRCLRQRPNAGTYLEFVSYDAPGGKGKQNGAIQTSGPKDQESLVTDLFKALALTWPNVDIKLTVNSKSEIEGVSN